MSNFKNTSASGSGDAASAGGVWIGELKQSDFDIDFYDRCLQRQPNDVRLLRLLGELYARRGEHERSVEMDQRLAVLLPDDGAVHYNLACSLSMRGSVQEAIGSLQRAIELGYNDFGHLGVDPDLVNVRKLPQYQALMKQYGLSG